MAFAVVRSMLPHHRRRLPTLARRSPLYSCCSFWTTPTIVRNNNNNNNKQLKLPQKTCYRSYMDVHARPSHSGMFGEKMVVSDTHKSVPQNPSFWTLLFRMALAASSVHVVTEHGGTVIMCEGPSMDPTLHPYGEMVLVDKWRRRRLADGSRGEERARLARERQQSRDDTGVDVWHEPRISVTDLEDKVPFRWWDAWQHMTSPLSVGDVVVVHHPLRRATVCKRILGLPGDQVLIATKTRGRRHGVLNVVPDGHLWLEGDNAANSMDSRSYGPVPAALVVGRVVARIWPLRGKAWMRRGGPPRQSSAANGSIVLPAGYDGQHITKHISKTQSGQ
jgi:signal peptidase I